MHFVYMFSDRSTLQTTIEPNKEDLKQAAGWELDIIKFDGETVLGYEPEIDQWIEFPYIEK